MRNLLAKLPPPGDGHAFVLDDEVALRFFRLQQMTEGSIDLLGGEADPLKGPTDVGTAQVKDEEEALSSLVDRLNGRFGTDFTDADQSSPKHLARRRVGEAALAVSVAKAQSLDHRPPRL